MIRKPGPAALEEQAELGALRERADATGKEIGETMAALVGKMTEASPSAAVRRKATGAMAAAGTAAGRMAGRLGRRAAGSPRAMVAAGATTGVIALAALAVLWQLRRSAWPPVSAPGPRPRAGSPQRAGKALSIPRLSSHDTGRAQGC